MAVEVRPLYRVRAEGPIMPGSIADLRAKGVFRRESEAIHTAIDAKEEAAGKKKKEQSGKPFLRRAVGALAGLVQSVREGFTADTIRGTDMYPWQGSSGQWLSGRIPQGEEAQKKGINR